MARAQRPPRWPSVPLTEVARTLVSADVAFERYGLSGRGSTLCLVDTGIDRAFATGRVRAVWDADGSARGGSIEAAVGGAFYDASSIGASPGDPHGHGTAMASIALSDEGLAPDAGLVMAAAYDPAQGGFPDEAVVRAVRMCRLLAAADDTIDAERLVILLSLGGHDGPHDGRGAFERAIVEAAGPVPVVVAAGNDGDRSVHAAGRVFSGELARVEVRVPRSVLEDAALGLTLELERLGEHASVRLVAPDGSSTELRAPGAFTLGAADVEVASRDHALALTLLARDGVLPSGEWAIEITGSARFDIWLAGAHLGSTFFPATLGGANVVAGEAISIPATAPELIAVGASIARPSVEGLAELGVAGDVAAFSSRGPTAAGVPKPDLVAPGGWMLARLSSDVRDGDPTNLVRGRRDRLVDGRVAVRGSSASAAMVAGALLLALELDPERGPQARALLVSSTDDAGWTPERGFGALDIPLLLARWSNTEAPAHRELIVTRPSYALSDEGLWIGARGAGEVLRVTVHGLDREASLEGGAAQIWLDPGAVRADELLHIEASIDGAALPPVDVLVVPDRYAPLGPQGGGCAAARGARRGLEGISGWALLLLIVWRRRPWGLSARGGARSDQRAHAARGERSRHAPRCDSA